MATWLSLGSAADVDTNEANYLSENAASLLGTYGSGTLSTVDAVAFDGDGDGVISDHDYGSTPDSVSIDGTTMVLDSTIAFSATVTRGDGTTYNTTVGVLQMTNGELYLLPISETDLDFLNIQSVQLTAVVKADYSGANVTTAARSIDNTNIVCFTRGTMIATQAGLVNVDDLAINDMIMTMDNGYQPIRWIGAKKVPATGHLSPVKIARGALGHDIPNRDMWVSQQHRILLRSKLATRMFDTSEILVPAKKLSGLPGISIDDGLGEVQYFHFLLPNHEIVFANGAPAESMYLGKEALGTVGEGARKEILSLFPELMAPEFHPQSARVFAPGKTIPGRVLNNLLRRARQNNKTLFESAPLPAN
ncbi:Hint domain-containing protein [Shimia gijangensis]|uniref:Hint domain-containing protein n=1 Tax=Shimia gijangensis TaxID=1470563 RepID=A0A1M6KLI2_9RHOB|nr:Hint domain-containing protein [Shimia gijangensis]SHJ59822.1 Hint domain-containing protein [Shimia gijangensis]